MTHICVLLPAYLADETNNILHFTHSDVVQAKKASLAKPFKPSPM